MTVSLWSLLLGAAGVAAWLLIIGSVIWLRIP
jgi:hypothetical protein